MDNNCYPHPHSSLRHLLVATWGWIQLAVAGLGALLAVAVFLVLLQTLFGGTGWYHQ